MARRPIQSPDCPLCGQPPGLKFGDQFYMCCTDGCECVSWNPSETVAHNLANRHNIELRQDGDAES